MKKHKNKSQKRERAPSAFDHAEISWIAPEAVRHERGTIWKSLMLIMTLLAIGLGIYFNAWTFSLAIGTFALVYTLVHREHPRDVEIKISNIGIKVGNRQYPFARVRAFWLIYEPPMVKTLNLLVDGELLPEVSIQLSDQNPAIIREFLMKKVPELSGKDESLTDIFLRIFKL